MSDVKRYTGGFRLFQEQAVFLSKIDQEIYIRRDSTEDAEELYAWLKSLGSENAENAALLARITSLERENAELRDKVRGYQEWGCKGRTLQDWQIWRCMKRRAEKAEKESADLLARITSLEREKEEARDKALEDVECALKNQFYANSPNYNRGVRAGIHIIGSMKGTKP